MKRPSLTAKTEKYQFYEEKNLVGLTPGYPNICLSLIVRTIQIILKIIRDTHGGTGQCHQKTQGGRNGVCQSVT